MSSVEVFDEQVAVLLLPFMAVRLNFAPISEECLHVSHLMKQNHEEEILRQVAVDADFMMRMFG